MSHYPLRGPVPSTGSPTARLLSRGVGASLKRWWEQPAPAEGHPDEPRWAARRARRAITWVLIPFICALFLCLASRWYRMQEASALIVGVAAELVEQKARQPDITDAKAIDQMLTARYGDGDVAEKVQYRRLAQTVAHDLPPLLEHTRLTGDDLRKLFKEKRARYTAHVIDVLIETSLWMIVVQSFFILMFAFFLCNSFSEAARRVQTCSSRAAQRAFRTFGEKVYFRRARYYLAEEGRPYLITTLAFAILIAEGSSYVLAPRGLMASMVGEYAMQHAPPGATSVPLWFQAFKESPGVVTGFAGFLLYATVTFLKQYSTGNLTRMMLLSLVNRGLGVLLISLALSVVLEGSERALLFLVGVFPQTGLDALARITQTQVEALLSEGNRAFAGLPELDFSRQTLLQNVGIFTVHDLASVEMHAVMQQVGIDPEVLLRAVDRAALMAQIGPEGSKALAEKLPLATASEVVLHVRFGEEIFREARRMRAAKATTAAEHSVPRLSLEEFTRLPAEEQQLRLNSIAEVLQAKDVRQVIVELENNLNVRYILLQKLTYQDDLPQLDEPETPLPEEPLRAVS